MKAKFVNESIGFKRQGNSRESLDLGFGKKNMETKAFKVLEFIADSGEEGRSFTEIQKYIYFDLNKAPKGEDWFESKSKGKWVKNGSRWDPDGEGPRASRGYWSTALGSYMNRKGLLEYYCEKNEKGKWVLKRWPKKDENIIGSY